MSFPSKLRAEYAELASQYLDNIPVEKPEDFDVIKEALKVITEPTQEHHVPATLEGRVSAIKEIIDQPEIYVEKRENDDEFKSIIVQRVAAKIQEIDALSGPEKEKYIAYQKEMKEKAAGDHKVMAEHKPPEPGSEAHTLSFDRWLEEETLRFQREGGDRLIREVRLPAAPNQRRLDFIIRRLEQFVGRRRGQPDLPVQQIMDALRPRVDAITNHALGLPRHERLEYLNGLRADLAQRRSQNNIEHYVLFCETMFLDYARARVEEELPQTLVPNEITEMEVEIETQIEIEREVTQEDESSRSNIPDAE